MVVLLVPSLMWWSLVEEGRNVTPCDIHITFNMRSHANINFKVCLECNTTKVFFFSLEKFVITAFFIRQFVVSLFSIRKVCSVWFFIRNICSVRFFH